MGNKVFCVAALPAAAHACGGLCGNPFEVRLCHVAGRLSPASRGQVPSNDILDALPLCSVAASFSASFSSNRVRRDVRRAVASELPAHPMALPDGLASIDREKHLRSAVLWV